MSVTLSAAKQARLVPALQAKGGRIIAGGTLIVADLNYGADSGALITLDRLGFDKIAVKGGKVTLGAMVTMAAIARDRRLKFLHPVATSIGGPAVRAMATIGGNLFAPAPYGDMAAALLALDAGITFHDGKATRKLPIETFLAQRRKLQKSCIVSISFAAPATGAFHYVKVVRRRPVSASVVTIAALLPQKAGRTRGARVVLGAMAATAIRARKAEEALEGRKLGDEAIHAAAKLVAAEASPADDAYATAWYRREIAPVHFARLLAA